MREFGDNARNADLATAWPLKRADRGWRIGGKVFSFLLSPRAFRRGQGWAGSWLRRG